jgi:TRAP-type C4-dicarboxylate transport system permease small subunit
MQPALAWAERILRALIGGGFLFALALNFANVVMRYAFHAPIYWAEEAMIFTFIWCVFLGGAVVTLSGEHLRVEFLEWALSPRLRQILRFVIHVVSAAVMLFVFWRAWSLVGMLVRLQQKSTMQPVA